MTKAGWFLTRRLLALTLPLTLAGCAEAIWQVDTDATPVRWARDPRVQNWPRPLNITYTFWTSGRVTADVSPAHQWWRHVRGTGWEIEAKGEPENQDTIVFDGVTEHYRRHYPGGVAILTVLPPGQRGPSADR